ncbi:two-component system sensor histidine kinase NtrB [Desulfotalea psychrophila]|uniref:two-component system sensor histidine kinase NtrB n=1 Tax=Desulfotalea psychrophila TaxID=84980 RepID=UPI00031F7E99|nr:ATP-binding protein [Desulfotalea psychrophila]
MKEKTKSEQKVDAVRKQKIDAGAQPFKLVKFFSFSSLVVILVFTLLLSWFQSKYSQKVMFEQSEAHTLLLAESINQQVFHRFVLPTVIRYGKISLREPEQYTLINRIITGLIHGMDIDSVKIYDSSKNVISYSTNSEIIGQEDQGGKGYTLALTGETSSKLIYGGSFSNLVGVGKSISCSLTTYIPFRQVGKSGESDGEILGVIEIDKDLTKEYSKILLLQVKLLLGSSVVMAVLFLVLRSIVARADKIMEAKTLERLRLEDKLNQAERLVHLGTMVATVSHEIKSPLGIVRSTAELLQKRIKKIAPGNEMLAGIIIDETTRLNDIVIEFLDFARPQKMNFVVATVDEIITKVLTFVTPQLKAQGVKLVTDFAPDLRATMLDQDAFYRALLNIVMNALQAMEEGGELQITTANLDDGAVLLRVRDTGRGISEENQAQIFNPFFTDRHKGTGLGLAITSNIIETHGGTVTVTSEPGLGSCFAIKLPRLA